MRYISALFSPLCRQHLTETKFGQEVEQASYSRNQNLYELRYVLFRLSTFPEISRAFSNLSLSNSTEKKSLEYIFTCDSVEYFTISLSFQGFSAKIQLSLSFPLDFHNLSNLLSSAGFPCFPDLWPHWLFHNQIQFMTTKDYALSIFDF